LTQTQHLPTPGDDLSAEALEAMRLDADRGVAARAARLDAEAGTPLASRPAALDPVVRAVGLTKRYNGVPVLNDVSLTLYAGEIFGLVGPNGAGKTTLMRILATLIRQDSGSAVVCGVDLSQPAAIRSSIGYMADVLGVYDDMLVGEYLEFFARAHRLPEATRDFAIRETMRKIGIEAWGNQPVDGLSRGMKQRLALARAILHDPKLLLLDEPASGLDPLARLELREILRRLQRQGVTVVISSHVLEDLADICDRVGVMNQGHLVLVRETAELIRSEGSKRLRVRALERQEALFTHLEATPRVAGLRWDNDSLVFAYQGASQADLAALLTDLVRAGFLLVRFAEEDSTLESAYLNVTSTV
jgi:ABC-2 type transport system ATP-binding protein